MRVIDAQPCRLSCTEGTQRSLLRGRDCGGTGKRLPEQSPPPIRAWRVVPGRGGATITWPSPRRRSPPATSPPSGCPTLLSPTSAAPGWDRHHRHEDPLAASIRPANSTFLIAHRRLVEGLDRPLRRQFRRCGSRPRCQPCRPRRLPRPRRRSAPRPGRGRAVAADTCDRERGRHLTAAMLSCSAGCRPKPPRRPDARRAYPGIGLHADDHLGRQTLDRTDQLTPCGSVTSPASPEPTMRSSALRPRVGRMHRQHAAVARLLQAGDDVGADLVLVRAYGRASCRPRPRTPGASACCPTTGSPPLATGVVDQRRPAPHQPAIVPTPAEGER